MKYRLLVLPALLLAFGGSHALPLEKRAGGKTNAVSTLCDAKKIEVIRAELVEAEGAVGKIYFEAVVNLRQKYAQVIERSMVHPYGTSVYFESGSCNFGGAPHADGKVSIKATYDPVGLLKASQCEESWKDYPKIYTLEILVYYEDGAADNCGTFTFRLPESAKNVTPTRKVKLLAPENGKKE